MVAENKFCCCVAANYCPSNQQKKWHGTNVKIQILPLEFTIQFCHVTSVLQLVTERKELEASHLEMNY
jgi:hypothetical protein